MCNTPPWQSVRDGSHDARHGGFRGPDGESQVATTSISILPHRVDYLVMHFEEEEEHEEYDDEQEGAGAEEEDGRLGGFQREGLNLP